MPVVERRYTPGGLVAREVRRDAGGREVARTDLRYDAVGRPRRAVTVESATGGEGASPQRLDRNPARLG